MLGVILLMTACGRPARPPVAAPAPTPPAPPTIKPSLPEIEFTIQVGAFSTSERAARYADHLQTFGLDAYYFIDQDGLYKVRFERFGTREAALQRAQDLHTRALIEEFFIVHPRPDSTLMDLRLALQESIVRTAQRFIGTAYRWGGTSQRDGFDCSGLTMTVYRLNGLELPRSAHDQFHAGTPVTRNGLQPGDLVFFATGSANRISHVGIYKGQGRFIHAPSQGNPIRTASLSNTYFDTRFRGARRYF